MTRKFLFCYCGALTLSGYTFESDLLQWSSVGHRDLISGHPKLRVGWKKLVFLEQFFDSVGLYGVWH